MLSNMQSHRDTTSFPQVGVSRILIQTKNTYEVSTSLHPSHKPRYIALGDWEKARPKFPGLIECKTPRCPICYKQYFQGVYEQDVQVETSDDQAQELITNYLRSIRQSQDTLLQLVDKHGTTIVNRWMKRLDKEDRETILRKFDPKLTEGKWKVWGKRISQMQFRTWERMEKEENEAKGLHQDTLQKHVDKDNVAEDLSTEWQMAYIYGNRLAEYPLRLFSLVHARASYPIEDWFPFDLEQTMAAVSARSLKIRINRHCVCIQGDDIGRVVPWTSERAHNGGIMAFPMAEIILWAQARVFELLAHTLSEVITGSGHQGESGRFKWDKIVGQGFRSDLLKDHWTEFSTRPFSSPLALGVDRLVEIAEAKRKEANDILWGMQTDITFFQHMIKSHVASKLSKFLAGRNPYEIVCETVFSVSVMSALWWEWISEECVHVRNMSEVYKESVVIGSNPPEEYARAITSLQFLVMQAWDYWRKAYFKEILHAPEFDGVFKLRKDDPTKRDTSANEPETNRHKIYMESQIEGDLHIGRNEYFFTDRVFWLLIGIAAEDREDIFLQPWLLALLDELLNDPKSLDFWDTNPTRFVSLKSIRPNGHLLQCVSDLAAVIDIWRSIQCARPASLPIDIREMFSGNQNRHFWRTFRDSNTQKANQDIVAQAAAMKRVYEYKPPRGDVNKEYIERYQQEDHVIEEFWRQKREDMVRVVDSLGIREEDRGKYMEKYSYNLHQDHISAREATLQRLQQRMLVKQANAELLPGEPAQLPEWQKPEDSNLRKAILDLPQPKQKLKTRDTAAALTGQSEPHAHLGEPIETSASQLTFEVKRTSFEVFNLIFSTAAKESASVRWNDFLSAMTDANFQVKARGGSAYSFRNGDLGSINEHRPHPVDVLNPIKLRFFGKRLRRNFGLGLENFTCLE
ncbi:MAG: hypothetical protein Q9227_009330 [Pyrenula ochraceoflavens]